jgi:hypothetical protein
MFSFTNMREVDEDVLEYYKGVRLRTPLLAAKSAPWSESIPHISILVIGHGRIKKTKIGNNGPCVESVPIRANNVREQ